MKKNNTGFTLLEVLVAAVIVILLTTVAVSSYVAVTRKSRDARRASDIEQLRQALEMYRSDNGYYPPVNTSDFGGVSALSNALAPYIANIPTDPKANEYQYIATDVSGGNYYGYCLAGFFETGSTVNDCATLPLVGSNQYNYGLRQP